MNFCPTVCQRFFAILLLLGGVVGGIHPLMATKAFAQSPTPRIKVVTFNTTTGSPNGRCSNPVGVPNMGGKVGPLAQYLKDNQVDIALLQEMVYFYKEEGCDFYHEVEELYKHLKVIGYPMDYVNPPFATYPHFMYTPIFSRYPIDHKTVEYLVSSHTSTQKRTYPRVMIDTPVGKIRVYNIHLEGGCETYGNFTRWFLQDPHPNKIMGGDFNLRIKNGYDCGQKIWEKTDIIGPGGNGIDFMMLSKEGLLRWSGPGQVVERGAFRDILKETDHPLIWEWVYSTNPPPPTPTPTPAQSKFCAVELSHTRTQFQAPVSLRMQATSTSNAQEPVNLVIKHTNNQPISPLPSGTRHVADQANGYHYYLMTPTVCVASATRPCLVNMQLPELPVGSYQVYCEMITTPGSCSGNPNCSTNGGPLNCSALVSSACSAHHIAVLTVDAVTRKPGDVNGDGRVDIYDFSLIIQNFGRTNCSVNLVGSCLIDIFDYQQIIVNFWR